MALRQSLAYLATGTLLNVVSQLVVSSYDFADKSAQIMPWVKFTGVLVPAALNRVRRGKHVPPITPHQKAWLTVIGLLDVVAYTLFSLAYYSCGAALSTLLLAAASQILTALSTVLVLKRRLSRGQWMGIACIVAGLALRALPGGGSAGGTELHAEQWVGAAMIVVSACLYTVLGIAYEKLTKGSASPPPVTEVMWHTSKLGFLLSTAYQLLFTLPRYDALVAQRMAANNLSCAQVLPLLLCFALAFNLHMLAQNGMFRAEGAIGVGVVNSVRGAVLAVVTSVLFCTPQQPVLCLTAQSGASAAVITLGGIAWVMSDPTAWQKRRAAAAARAKGRGEGEGEGPPSGKGGDKTSAGAAAAAAATKDKEL